MDKKNRKKIKIIIKEGEKLMRKKKEPKRPGKKVSVIPRKTAVSVTLRSDLTQAICSIMTLLQGISTPEEDWFIQVSVFVPEGRLWLLV